MLLAFLKSEGRRASPDLGRVRRWVETLLPPTQRVSAVVPPPMRGVVTAVVPADMMRRMMDMKDDRAAKRLGLITKKDRWDKVWSIQTGRDEVDNPILCVCVCVDETVYFRIVSEIIYEYETESVGQCH